MLGATVQSSPNVLQECFVVHVCLLVCCHLSEGSDGATCLTLLVSGAQPGQVADVTSEAGAYSQSAKELVR